jgi:hypothetical protein
MPAVNPKRTFTALNNNAGAFTVIRLTTWAKYVRIKEDPAYQSGDPAAGQGLQGNYLDPFAQSANITKGMTPAVAGDAVFVANASIEGGVEPVIEFGSRHALSDGKGMPLGNPGSDGNIDVPGGQVTLGTPLIQLRSNSANATGIIIEEYVG